MSEINFKETEIGMIPEDWKVVELNKVIEKLIDYRGKTPKKTKYGIPLITAKIIKGGKINYNNLEYISKSDYDSWMTRGIPKAGDLVITTEAPLGEVAQLNNEKIALAQRVITLRGKKDILNNTFFKYFYLSKSGKHALKSRETGSVVTGIKQSTLKQTSVILPPLSEQKAISEILSSLDDKIELLEKQNQTLENIGQAIFKSWFVDFEPFQEDLVESEMGMIPRGWKIKQLKDLCNYQNGFGFYKLGYSNSGKKVVDLLNIDTEGNFKESIRDKFLGPDIYNNPKYEKFLLKKNDLVMVMTDMTQGMGILGKVGRILEDNKFILNQRIFRIRHNKEININFLQSYLNSYSQNALLKSKALGTVQKYVNTGHILEQELIIPHKDIMIKYSKIIDPIYKKKFNNIYKIQTLTHLRNSLLPRLMNGKIRVKF